MLLSRDPERRPFRRGERGRNAGALGPGEWSSKREVNCFLSIGRWADGFNQKA